ncbi:MAG: leucine-rich repeat domain-containing protein [Promethearchaeota archaeon]
MKKFNLNDNHHHDEKFYLLSKLIKAGGEPNAINTLKTDILNKFNKGHSTVVDFLYEKDYIDLLTSDDIKLILKYPAVDILAIKWMEKEMNHFREHPPYLYPAKSIEETLNIETFGFGEEYFDEFGEIISEKFPNKSVFISEFYDEGRLWMDFEDEWQRYPILFYAKTSEVKELAILNPPVMIESRNVVDFAGYDDKGPDVNKYILRGCFHSLETLYLDACFFDKNYLSIIFQYLKSLRKLRISYSIDALHSTLTELPDSIGNLKLLRELEISFAKLCSIPESIGNLSSLEYLSLLNTEIGTLPDSIGNLKSLRELNILHTKIKKLPKSIKKKKDLLIKL